MARYGDGSPDKPFFETDKPKPVDPYGVAKVSSEKLLKNMAELYGFKTLTLVPHNVFGTRGKWNDPFRGVIYIMINRLLRGEPIIIYGDGEQKRSWTFADDVLSFIPQLLYKYTEFNNGEVFNIGSDDASTYLSINELAELVQTISNIRTDVIYQNNLSNVKHAWCSAQKIKDTFNWSSQKTIEQGIREIVQHIMMNGGARDWDYNTNIELDNIVYPDAWKKSK
jgi:UDP-glucose 4-epimerase